MTAALTNKPFKRLLSDSQVSLSDTRTITFTFATSDIARDGHRILPGAWQSRGYDGTKNFMSYGGPFLFAHDTDQPSIGKVISIREQDGCLKGAVRFAEHDFAQTIYDLYRGGFMRGCSVSWIPVDWSYATGQGRSSGAIDFKRVELLEISGVPVPCDVGALAEARSRGIKVDPLMELLKREELELRQRQYEARKRKADLYAQRAREGW